MNMSQGIIIEPILSEKSAALQESQRKYAFKVLKSANKIDIKKIVESRFDVKVEKVATMNMNGKVKRSTMRSGGRVIRRVPLLVPAWVLWLEHCFAVMVIPTVTA
jgi:large subunit ribosomal protein L23